MSLAALDENTKLTDCYYEKKDWRACKEEVRIHEARPVSECTKANNTRSAQKKDGEIPRVLEAA